MQSVLLAELTILVEFDSIRIVLLVLVGLIVAALALSAGQRNCIAHFMHSFWLDYWDTTKCHWYNLSQIPTHVNNFIRKYWQSWHFIYRHNKTPHKQGVKSHSWWLRRDLNSWHSGYEPNALANWATQPYNGADNQSWTGDLILTKDALYLLSYISTITNWLREEDSNLWPSGYEPDELPTAPSRDVGQCLNKHRTIWYYISMQHLCQIFSKIYFANLSHLSLHLPVTLYPC